MSHYHPTQLFGVIGDPISHSKSPEMFQAAFRELSYRAQYKAFLVKPVELKDFLEKLKSGEISGINVTIPHKQNVLHDMSELTNFASRVKAVNTVSVKEGKLIGHNTDGPGYVQSLLEDTHIKLKNKKILIIGAGGATRAICHALCEENPHTLVMTNRTQSKAELILKDLQNTYSGILFESLEFKMLGKQFFDMDLIINTSSMGMANNHWINLDFIKKLPQKTVVSDIVYNPKDTSLLLAAKKEGLQTHPGYGMLLHQAALAFEIFTGQKAPLSVMKSALLKSL